jgi:hypothetical protein
MREPKIVDTTYDSALSREVELVILNLTHRFDDFPVLLSNIKNDPSTDPHDLIDFFSMLSDELKYHIDINSDIDAEVLQSAVLEDLFGEGMDENLLDKFEFACGMVEL